jgi:hypothetical protein
MVTLYDKSGMKTSSDVTSKKGEYDKRFNSMKGKAQHYIASWKDLKNYLNPTRGLFDDSKERGNMIDHKVILAAHATHDIKKTASGLNSGITSKTRPWFRLNLANDILSNIPHVRAWLDEVQHRMFLVLQGSNIYNTFQNIYEELLTFGTGCFILLEDFDKIIRTRSFTIGEYFLGIDKTGRVNSFARSFKMTVAQMIKAFGYENCSTQVQTSWNSGLVDKEFIVRHLIEPNDTVDGEMEDFKGMPWRSIYWEQSNNEVKDFLDLRGFKRFPVVAPRWSVPTTDVVYGFGPGWDALGDVKELQKTKYDKLMAQEKLHNPPMQSDANVDGYANLLPGGITKVSANTPNAGLQPTYQIDPNLESFIQIINECKDSIDKHFYTDLFTMLASMDKTNMTATEIAAREREIIMLMGPILNQLDEEMLSQVIELLYGIMNDNNLLPEPPKEIEGIEIKIQYISVLAQMQRAVGLTSIEKVVGYAGNVSALNEESRDIINWDESIREYAKMEGSPQVILNDQPTVRAMRESRQKLIQAQQALAAGESAAKTGKTLSETELGKGSALDVMRESVSGKKQ